MSEKSGSISIVVKALVAIAVLAGAAWGVMAFLRPVAIVEPVTRGTAIDAVTGSVEVHADKDIFALKSEASGTVISTEGLDDKKPFKKGDLLVQLDPTDLQQEIDVAVRAHDNNQRRLLAAFANDQEWNAANRRLDEAGQAEKSAKDPSAEEAKRLAMEVSQRQDELDTLTSHADLDWIKAKEALDNANRMFALRNVAQDVQKEAQRTFDAIERKLRLARLEEHIAEESYAIDLKAKRRALDKLSIRAPFDGRVQDAFVRPGAIIGGGTVLANLFSNARQVVARISEEDIGKVALGQPAKVRLLAYPNQEFDAQVTDISKIAEENTQRYKVTFDVKVDPEQLIPFNTGEVSITVGTHGKQPLIPRRALFNDKTDADNVFVVKDGVVEKRQVKHGFLSLNLAEIVQGLQPGELVITDELERFRDGDHVRVAREK